MTIKILNSKGAMALSNPDDIDIIEVGMGKAGDDIHFTAQLDIELMEFRLIIKDECVYSQMIQCQS